MKKTLYLKFIAAYLLFGVFGFIIVATFVTNMMTEHCRRETAEDLYRGATQIASTYAADLYSAGVTLDTVNQELATLSDYMDAQIWIVSPSGRLITNSEQAPDPDEELFIENFDPNITAGNYYTEGTFFDSFSETYLSVLAPIISSYSVKGYVVIHTPFSRIESKAASLVNISYMMLLVILLLSLIILIFFTEIVYRPLRRITTATEQYAAGNMHYELSVDSEDEMGYLAGVLSYMASEIARAEDDQKKFIANVSHDFRSPLTSIQGFLSAMLDGTIPPELHEKYLGVVLTETERLTKLTNDLLSLNNLNTRGVLLAKTDFDINDSIRRMALSFEQVCRNKNINVELVLLGETLFVTADKERIEQVLYNLVDNAIKFTGRGGTIRIETSEKKNKVFVSIKDNGIGIPKDDQKYIWDRFYKTDLSRGKDKKGTGLGLSIVREIIRAHDENINLISTEGVGSEFIFTLRRSERNDELEED